VPGSTLVLKGASFQDEHMKVSYIERFVELAVDASAPGFNFKVECVLRYAVARYALRSLRSEVSQNQSGHICYSYELFVR
jgi:hypothetical protein